MSKFLMTIPRHFLRKLKIGGLPPLPVWFPLLKVNHNSEFQVNIFSYKRNIRKCQSFHTTPDNDEPGLWQYLNVFFQNSWAKMGHNYVKNVLRITPLLVGVPLLRVNNLSEFQVNILRNDTDIRKCKSFFTTTPMQTLLPLMTGLWQYLDVFFKNSRAKNMYQGRYLNKPCHRDRIARLTAPCPSYKKL